MCEFASPNCEDTNGWVTRHISTRNLVWISSLKFETCCWNLRYINKLNQIYIREANTSGEGHRPIKFYGNLHIGKIRNPSTGIVSDRTIRLFLFESKLGVNWCKWITILIFTYCTTLVENLTNVCASNTFESHNEFVHKNRDHFDNNAMSIGAIWLSIPMAKYVPSTDFFCQDLRRFGLECIRK